MKHVKNNVSRCAVYSRKSTDSEDRQVLSIPAQIQESYRLAGINGIPEENIDLYSESKSARKPGRAEFNRLIDEIENGSVEIVICWDLDRLARNPIDGGKIIWLLILGKIKQIITPTEVFYPYSNMLLLNVKFGMATQYSLDLSKNVKRGNKTKLVEKGWWTTLAPMGYLNNPDRSTWDEEPIIPDPERFHLVRKMWDLFLTGAYSIPKIVDIANNEWGFRTVQRKRQGGKKLSKSGLHRILNNTFYYGYMVRGENEAWGKHKPMISQGEFEKAQKILRKNGGTRLNTRDFAYRGIFTCDCCGCSVTAQDVTNRHGTTYTYYSCTRKKNTKDFKCSTKSIREEDLESQVSEILQSFKIPEDFMEWGKLYLRLTHQKQAKNREEIYNNHEKNFREAEKKLNSLTDMKLSGLLSDEEFIKQKNRLMAERNQAEELLGAVKKKGDDGRDLIEKTYDFLCYAEKAFKTSTTETKLSILNALGTNYRLTPDKKIKIELFPLFEQMKTMQTELYSLSAEKRFKPYESEANKHENKELSERLVLLKNGRFKPSKNTITTGKTMPDFEESSIWRKGWDSNPRYAQT